MVRITCPLSGKLGMHIIFGICWIVPRTGRDSNLYKYHFMAEQCLHDDCNVYEMYIAIYILNFNYMQVRTVLIWVTLNKTVNCGALAI